MSIEKSYDIWSSQYDYNQNITRDLDQKSTIKTLNKFKFSFVIELGCGTGKNTRYLLEKADNIIGLDFSQEMLNKAKEKINDERVSFYKTDLTKDWNIKDNIADLITCSLVLEHIENINFIFSQAYKKLRQNGVFFISELHPFKQYTGSKAKYETGHGFEKLKTYTHHTSEYLNVGRNNGFELIELEEWFDEDDQAKIPRLIGLLFRKNQDIRNR